MQLGIYIIAAAIMAFVAVPVISTLPQPFSVIGLLIATLAFPVITVWLLQEEAHENQHSS